MSGSSASPNVSGGGKGIWVAEDLILPVPDSLSAVYMVPVPPGFSGVEERVRSALPALVSGPVGKASRKMLEVGAVRVATLPARALLLPTELQEHLGVDLHLVRVVNEAQVFATFSAAWPPGWPPVHESVARACAATLAFSLEMPLVDVFVPVALAPGPAIASLPDAASNLRLADWILVLQSVERSGLRATTKGTGQVRIARTPGGERVAQDRRPAGSPPGRNRGATARSVA